MPRSKTRALAKQAHAVRLYTGGCTFQEIADQVGFANRGTVHRVVNKALNEQIVDDIDLHRVAKDMELNRLLAACWDIINADDASVSDKIRAIGEATKIIGQQARLFALDCHECDMSWRMLVRGEATQERQHQTAKPGPDTEKAPEPVVQTFDLDHRPLLEVN